MPREVAVVTIPEFPAPCRNRDKGKTFVLTEMSARKAEKWASRVYFAIANARVPIPEGIEASGIIGLAVIGLRAFESLRYQDAEPLLDEMFDCVTIRPDPTNPNIERPLVENDTEEVATLLYLRQEIFSLHVGFSIADALSKLKSDRTSADLSTTQTSQEPSEPSSQPA